MKNSEIKDYLLTATDGPVTKFVVMYRALELAATKTCDTYEIANVLDDCLDDLTKFGDIPSNEFSHSL
jgi:hypothetical protein